MLVIGNSQENDAVFSAAGIEAFLRSDPYLVRKETPGFYLRQSLWAPRQVSGSARIAPQCAIRVLDCAETLEFENPLTDPMLPGPSRIAAKLANLRGFDFVGFDEYHPWASPMPSGPARMAARSANPRVDWKETPEISLLEVDLPGLKKEQVKLEVEKGRTLLISGKWSTGKLEEAKNYTRHFNERSSGEFLRRFELPENAKMDQIKATMGNGVLTVTVPKEEAKIIEISEDDANMDQNDVLSVKTIDKGIDKGKGVMGIVIGQVKATKRD